MNARRLAWPLIAVHAAVLLGGALAATGRPAQDPVLVTAPAASAPPLATAAPQATVAARPVTPVTTPTPAPAPVAAAVPRATATTRPAPAPQRRVWRTGHRPYATVGPVTLHFPVDRVEVVGLHESGHDGAQPQSPLKSEIPTGRLASRSRGTDGQGAADIAVDPRRPVRAPVTGTVVRAGSYTLYCDHTDDYLVVEPDARPGWEVKMLHFDGVSVSKGDRVQAGVTVVGTGARVLPFASQVDKHTVAPHWPHLHIEVVDTAVEDRPSGRTCD